MQDLSIEGFGSEILKFQILSLIDANLLKSYTVERDMKEAIFEVTKTYIS
jgi:hypothetical protein